MKVAHRDIKPENLLLDNLFSLRVADWGLSAVRVELDAAILRTQCGTVSLYSSLMITRNGSIDVLCTSCLQRAYMAPELLRRVPYAGETADVWSAGVVLFIMIAGFPPFQQAAPGE